MMDTPQSSTGSDILAIDQNQAWISWATQVLTRDGYRIQVKPSFAEAEHLLETKNFDLVVIGADIANDHLDAIRKLADRKAHRARFLVFSPVVLSYMDLRQLWKAGVSEIAAKPYNHYQLLKIVSLELKNSEPTKVSGEDSSLSLPGAAASQ